MTIIEFYKELSRILEMRTNNTISKSDAEVELRDLLNKAKESNLDVNINEDILSQTATFEEEKPSYDPIEDSYESSYDDETPNSYN